MKIIKDRIKAFATSAARRCAASTKVHRTVEGTIGVSVEDPRGMEEEAAGDEE